jgi:quercetin dioxygenase-like cupin family protein
MSAEPVIVQEQDLEWEGWPADQVAERGESEWKTLISGGLTNSEALTVGLSRLPPGGSLRAHRHEQAEVYLVLAGDGVVTIDGEQHQLSAGATVFIPGDAVHAVEATGDADLRVAYVFAADSFDDVEYVFTQD